MDESKKTCIGVVAAEVNSIEQRQIMQGIIMEAQRLGKQTVVFSNLYNPYEYDHSLELENSVYELIFSQNLCGLVMIAESFTNDTLREKVRRLLEQRQDIPTVIIGIYIPALDFPNVRFINASDHSDTEDIANHLIEVHRFTQIDILTGMRGNEAAEKRVLGYRHALESHGIAFDEARVHYGNFWVNSGEALAQKYISGEYELPEAILCTNDYMAYGVLDTFLHYGIRVPEDVTVTGYEFIHERIFHAPLLTTYQRCRSELGSSAVRMVDLMVNGTEPPPFVPPHGTMIIGGSCKCGVVHTQLYGELENLRTKQMYDHWNVLGTLEQQLTLCSTLDELVGVLSRHHYWVRDAHNMYLCLCENWYDTHAECAGDIMSCRSVMPWNEKSAAIVCSRYDLETLFQPANPNAVHYYLPLFFESHFFGYFVLEYDSPDTYDDIFRNWMKSISIGLTFLCMKNDIRYLLQCQNLSEQNDSLTGLYNRRGMESALSARLASEEGTVYAVAIKIGALKGEMMPESQAEQSSLMQKAAEIFRLTGLQDCICARTAPHIFMCAGFPCDSDEQCRRIGDKLFAVLLHHADICNDIGMESVLVESASIPPSQTASECITNFHTLLEHDTTLLAVTKSQPHADMLHAVRNRIYSMELSSSDAICRQYSFSAGYFRQVYKEAFGISFHQDVIQARVFRAIYLLETTVLSIASVAEQCGYDDCNYFMRQFRNITGLTPAQYRKQI